jgi:hypothetical protein
MMQAQQRLQQIVNAIESRKAILIAEMTKDYAEEEQKITGEYGADPAPPIPPKPAAVLIFFLLDDMKLNLKIQAIFILFFHQGLSSLSVAKCLQFY